MPSELTSSQILSAIPGLSHGFVSNHDPEGQGRSAHDLAAPLVATVNQVHGSELLWVKALERRERNADAIATLIPGLPVGVYSADCTPILMAATDEKGAAVAVLAVHAGWRGTAALISEKAFASFAPVAEEEGAVQFHAVVGPCISYESFEVGEEVVRAFPGSLEQGFAKRGRMDGGTQKFHFDLPRENERQLNAYAARSGRSLVTEILPLCTFALKDRFPSYRRDGKQAGRILSYLSFGRDDRVKSP